MHNDVFAHEDFIPTLMAAVGEADIVDKLKAGYQAGDKTFKVHLDGYNLLPYFKGEEQEPPRKEFLYWNDDGKLVALRYGASATSSGAWNGCFCWGRPRPSWRNGCRASRISHRARSQPASASTR